jgi:pSer/pThr/pTyr-binding forkhead associated (FHA) protein
MTALRKLPAFAEAVHTGGGEAFVHTKGDEMTTVTPEIRTTPPARRRKPVVIGRHADSDFVIDERTVSRRHAVIQRRGYGWIVEDLGSLNGTRVNGRPVRSRAIVAPGDTIGFGAATARFDPDERRVFSELRVEDPTGEV